MNEKSKKGNKSSFSQEQAKAIIGKLVVIGITYYDHVGKFIEQEQMHGRIVSADKCAGVAIELEGIHKGETFRLPSDLDAFKKAEPGEYREFSTGDVVTNPDLITTWEVTKSEADE
jgi:hypothetical protein